VGIVNDMKAPQGPLRCACWITLRVRSYHTPAEGPLAA